MKRDQGQWSKGRRWIRRHALWEGIGRLRLDLHRGKIEQLSWGSERPSRKLRHWMVCARLIQERVKVQRSVCGVGGWEGGAWWAFSGLLSLRGCYVGHVLEDYVRGVQGNGVSNCLYGQC